MVGTGRIKHPLAVLERLLTGPILDPRLIEHARPMVEADAELKKYVQRQCALADAALMGDCSIGSVYLVDRLGIRSTQELWQYREAMANICGYKPAQTRAVWIPTSTPDESSNVRLIEHLRSLAPSDVRIAGMFLGSDYRPPSVEELSASLGIAIVKPEDVVPIDEDAERFYNSEREEEIPF